MALHLMLFRFWYASVRLRWMADINCARVCLHICLWVWGKTIRYFTRITESERDVHARGFCCGLSDLAKRSMCVVANKSFSY